MMKKLTKNYIKNFSGKVNKKISTNIYIKLDWSYKKNFRERQQKLPK